MVRLEGGREATLLIHVAPVTTHARNTDGEVRVQPPGQNRPVLVEPDCITLILGFDPGGDDTPPVIVAVPAGRHEGRNERWTVTFRLGLIDAAASEGWAVSDRPVAAGGYEQIIAFQAPLLSSYVESIYNGVSLSTDYLRAAIIGSGLLDHPDDFGAQQRSRIAVSRLMRDAKFAGLVKSIYGERCAMCGMGMGLVAGAHVYPAAAPGSVDEVWNGICLCENHHRAFDKHLIGVDPETFKVTLHQDFFEAAGNGDRAARAFIEITYSHIEVPIEHHSQKLAEMFRRRAVYFGEK